MNTSEAPATTAAIENHLFTIKIRLVRFGTLQKSSVVESSFALDGIKIFFFKDDVIGWWSNAHCFFIIYV